MGIGMVAALDSLRAEPVADLGVAELGGQLVDLLRDHAVLDGEITRRLARFDALEGFAESGAVDTVAWLRCECRLAPAAAAERVRVARATQAYPDLGSALESGAISHQHAAVIARATEDSPVPVAAQMAPQLLDLAARTDPASLRGFAKELQGRIDPDGMLSDANRDHARRYLHLGARLDGMFSLDGLLDTEGGRRLEVVLSAVMGPPARDEEATPAQRRADALIHLADQHLAGGSHGPATVGGQRPHITLTVDVGSLANRQPGTAWLDRLFPIPSASVMRLACDGTIDPIVLSEAGDPLHVGRSTRTIPPARRRAASLRDGHCRFPGCDRPVHWCDCHHLVHWVDGGQTSLDNVVNLCRRHHRLVHEGGWKLAGDPNVTISAVDPSGGVHMPPGTGPQASVRVAAGAHASVRQRQRTASARAPATG